MKILNYISGKVLQLTVGSLFCALAFSCTDELSLDNSTSIPGERLPKIDMENSLVIPLSMNIGTVGVSTREALEEDEYDDSSLQNGTASDHYIDFGLDNECFAFFFNDNGDFMYLKQLYTNSALGSGTSPKDGIGEYNVYAMAYITKPEGWEYQKTLDDFINKEETDEEKALRDAQELYDRDLEHHITERKKKLPAKLLVVLNGGRIYPALISKYGINEADGTPQTPGAYNADSILNFKWKYNIGSTSSSSGSSSSGSTNSNGLQVIGTNHDGHFTMTNSAYYGPDEIVETINDPEVEKVYPGSAEKSSYRLQTVRPINKDMIVDATAQNITQDHCAAKVYLERMVAKFSAPKFPTEVIGSNKVFRPSEDAQSVVIYSYDSEKKIWTSEETNWRIHVLGWTINGREKENYLFKHIRDGWEGELGQNDSRPGYKDGGYIRDWNSDNWNDPHHRRSYWSIDPHYEFSEKNEDDNNPGFFYPWQYRSALDKRNISWTHQTIEDKKPLRYLSFNDVRYWDETAITISENTFNPYFKPEGSDVVETVINNKNYLDNRGALLMGPHLLVTAELYLAADESPDNDYISQFKRVEHLYADRYFRYFRTEKDMFRMFVKDLNDALRTQSKMSFKFYRWEDAERGNNSPDTYEAIPTGHCQLMIDCELGQGYVESLKDEEQEIYTILVREKEKYHLKPVADVLDDLVKDLPYLTINAAVKDGDARKIPWIPGLVFRNIDYPDQILKVLDAAGHEIEKWDDNLRKSLIFEWFGAVDHFQNGYMYYAAEIPHHIDKNTRQGYYGAVRNHWYTFTVTSINALGTPVDDPNQKIIPGRFQYRDQISVYVEPAKWHFIKEVAVGFE